MSEREIPFVVTVPQAAAICNLTPRTISNFFASGKIRGYRIPGSQEIRIPREYLIRFMKEQNISLDTPIQADPTGQPLEPVPGGIEHTRSCPALGLSEPRGPGTSEDCTCCLRWKIALQTEQTMHVAWRKRAEEAEAENADIKNELSHMRESEAIQDRAVLLENVKALESRLIAGEPVPGSKSTQADMAIAEKLRPELERLLQSECEKFPAAKKTTPDPEKMARINELVKKIESEESKKEAGGEGGELRLEVGATVEINGSRYKVTHVGPDMIHLEGYQTDFPKHVFRVVAPAPSEEVEDYKTPPPKIVGKLACKDCGCTQFVTAPAPSGQEKRFEPLCYPPQFKPGRTYLCLKGNSCFTVGKRYATVAEYGMVGLLDDTNKMYSPTAMDGEAFREWGNEKDYEELRLSPPAQAAPPQGSPAIHDAIEQFGSVCYVLSNDNRLSNLEKGTKVLSVAKKFFPDQSSQLEKMRHVLDKLEDRAVSITPYPDGYRPCAWEAAMDLPEDLTKAKSELETMRVELEKLKADNHRLRLGDMSVYDFERMRDWIKDPNRKPSMFAITAGSARTAMLAVEESGILSELATLREQLGEANKVLNAAGVSDTVEVLGKTMQVSLANRIGAVVNKVLRQGEQLATLADACKTAYHCHVFDFQRGVGVSDKEKQMLAVRDKLEAALAAISPSPAAEAGETRATPTQQQAARRSAGPSRMRAIE